MLALPYGAGVSSFLAGNDLSVATDSPWADREGGSCLLAHAERWAIEPLTIRTIGAAHVRTRFPDLDRDEMADAGEPLVAVNVPAVGTGRLMFVSPLIRRVKPLAVAQGTLTAPTASAGTPAILTGMLLNS